MHSLEAVGSGAALCVVLSIHWKARTTFKHFFSPSFSFFFFFFMNTGIDKANWGL